SMREPSRSALGAIRKKTRFVAWRAGGIRHHASTAQMIRKVIIHATQRGIRLGDSASGKEDVLVIVSVRRAATPVGLGNRVASNVAPVELVHRHCASATPSVGM